MSFRRDLLGGIVLLVIGAILLLRNLGYLPAGWDQWWPIILIVIGAAIMFRPAPPEMAGAGPAGGPAAGPAGVRGERRHGPTGGLILIGLGLAFLAGNVIGGRSTGALVLIALGLALIVGRLWR